MNPAFINIAADYKKIGK
jgi:hypothetical protein